MSKKERRLFHIIFTNFINSFKIHKHKLIGEDYFGTKYYEIQNTKSSRAKPSRYFVPVNKNDHTQEIPVEWQAWLRQCRKYPPSAEEIQKNHELKMLTKQNAAQINATFKSNKSEEQNLSIEQGGSFPFYKDYESHDQGGKK